MSDPVGGSVVYLQIPVCSFVSRYVSFSSVLYILSNLYRTQVYKIAERSAQPKTTGAYNLAGLTKEPGTNDVGKMSDAAIKDQCSEQYFVQQERPVEAPAGCGLPWFCRFENIADYADGAAITKYCSSTYNANPGAYDKKQTAGQWHYGFSSWSSTGAIILQLNYGDGRLGSHGANGCPDYTNCGGGNNVGCHSSVYCL